MQLATRRPHANELPCTGSSPAAPTPGWAFATGAAERPAAAGTAAAALGKVILREGPEGPSTPDGHRASCFSCAFKASSACGLLLLLRLVQPPAPSPAAPPVAVVRLSGLLSASGAPAAPWPCASWLMPNSTSRAGPQLTHSFCHSPGCRLRICAIADSIKGLGN